jgi:hypothetical protein
MAGIGLFLLFSLFSPILPLALAETVSGFQVTFPKEAKEKDPIKLHVTLSPDASRHEFNRLQINLDGQPVAMADMSEERSSWITLAPQSPGTHLITVIWRNPPGGSPLSRSASVTVLPANTSNSQKPDEEKNP